MTRRAFLASASLVLRAAPARPNLLLILTDQQTHSALSAAGNPWLRTPAMDSLAAGGVRFTEAVCPYPVCSPSRGSLFTSRMPHETGVRGNQQAIAVGIAAICMCSIFMPLAALVAAGMRETAEPTAQLFSNVLFAATLRLFCDAEAARPGSMPTRRLALAVIGIQVLWTQLHGGNPTGVALAGAFFLAAPSLPRFGLLAAQALATCAGPYGLRVHTHFFAHREAFAAVREFQPLHVALAAGSGVHFAFVGLVAVAAIALAVRARSGERVRFEAAALSGLLVVTLFHVRLSTETALVALVAIAPLAARVPLRPLLSSAFAIAVFAACLALSARPPGFGLDAARFPVAAVEYLKRERPPGPMWNGYNFGGYLLFAYPEERVFIDGRAFIVYTDEQVRELVALYDDPSRFDALQARWGFRLAVMQRRGRGAALLDRLERGGAWRVSYEDDVATVLVRP